MMLKDLLSLHIPDPNGVKLCMDYWEVCQVWDDLIDKDKPVTDAMINNAFHLISLSIPSNPVFIANRHIILPIWNSVISQWHAANTFESQKTQLHKAYMLRAQLYELFACVYRLYHGMDADCSVIYALYGEIYEDYEKEILCQNQ